MTKQNSKPKGTSGTSNTHFVPPIGLALGSGMARGMAHIGVLKGLAKHGIEPTIVCGTSIGAVVGGTYLAGKLDVLEDWALNLNRRRVFSYMDFRSRSASLIGGKKLDKLLREHFQDMRIEDLPHPFVAIATDIVTGHEVWLRKGDAVKAIKASFALPGVFPTVNHNHRTLIDGALVNPVPVSACLALGSRVTIAVDLNADLIGKAAKPGQSFQTITGFDIFDNDQVSQADQKKFSIGLGKRLFGRETNNASLFGVMVSSLNIIQDRLTRSRLAGDPPDVHIKPRIGHIGIMEFEKAEEMIAEGEAAVDRALPELNAAMEVLLPRIQRDEYIPEKESLNKTKKKKK